MLLLPLLLSVWTLQAPEQEPVETPVVPQYFRPPTHRATLSEVVMRVRVAAKHPGESGGVTFPTPSTYSGQSIVSFRVQTEPASALVSWNWQPRSGGLNNVVRVNVSPQNADVYVSYSARVLLPGSEVVRTQIKDFSAWTGPSACVQSKDKEIVAVATELRRGHKTQSDLVQSVVKWVARNHKDELGDPNTSDAKSALATGGSSLGRANLCAAILRASGIPARTVAYVPTFGEGMEAEWWLTEYWSEDGAWEMVEPTIGLQHPARNSVMVLSISSRRDESREREQTTALHQDAPCFSTPEISSELKWSQSHDSTPVTSMQVLRVFPGPAGSRVMIAGYHRSHRVLDAAQKGHDDWFDDAILKEVLAGGPINFALFLDDQPLLPKHQH